MCFDGPARTTAHEMWYITAAAAMTSTVLMRPLTCFHGPALAVAHDMWFTTATTTTCLGVPGSLSAKNSNVRMMHFWQISSGIQCNRMPCASIGLKPWCRCGCTDDTSCRLGDAGCMTFLPWYVPRTEPPMQHREVGPDRGHLLTESCSDVHLHVCADVEPGMRTAAPVAWEAAAKISMLVLA